jgi:exopolysaccharide biosynthesis polyprenyl glycosylphosphotransferase
MIRRQRSGLIGWFLLSDFLGILISYFYSYGFRFYMYIIPVNPEKGIPPLESYALVFPLFLAIHLLIFFLQGFYRTRLKRTKIDDFFLVTLNSVLTILIIQAILSYLNTYSQGAAPLFRVTFKLSHGFLGVYFVVVVLMVSFFRNQIFFFMKKRYAKGMNLKSVLVVGAGDMGKSVAEKLAQYKDLGFVVKGFLDDDRSKGDMVDVDGGLPVLGPLSDLEPVLEKGDISDVYVALDLNNYGKILETLKVVNKYVVNVRLIPDLFQLLTLKARVEDLDGFPVISVDEPPLRGMMLLAKKIMDTAVSLVILLVFSPLLLLIALLIKLTSKGPVLYHQERMGLDGKRFIMHKFRTMVSDAESETGPVMCSQDDPRITKIGRLLRKLSLDEIPQLVNVLRGEMSLVGPRPERPVFVKEFREKIPKYMLRHKVKSGITGWAQVHGLRQDTPIDKRLEYDFYYIQNWSLGLDMKILWKTLRKGFIDRSL